MYYIIFPHSYRQMPRIIYYVLRISDPGTPAGQVAQGSSGFPGVPQGSPGFPRVPQTQKAVILQGSSFYMLGHARTCIFHPAFLYIYCVRPGFYFSCVPKLVFLNWPQARSPFSMVCSYIFRKGWVIDH